MARAFSTESLEGETRPPRSRPVLYLALEGARPAAGGERHELSQFGEVLIGRGAGRTAAVSVRSATQVLSLTVPDPAMSTQHARLVLDQGRWVVEDRHSKNGLRVERARLTRALLEPGTAFFLGRTAFVYDEDDQAFPAEPPVVPTLAAPVAAVAAALERAAEARGPLWLLGETGTGKTEWARRAHQRSGRQGSLLNLVCARLEAEGALLADKVRGAGTVVLDEPGDLTSEGQALVARLLDEGLLSLGGGAGVVVTSTQPPDSLVAAGRLRADLAARLLGLALRVPRLSARRMDLGLWVARLLETDADGGRDVSFSGDAVVALLCHRWPFNLHELGQALRSARALAGPARIEPSHLPEGLHRKPADPKAHDTLSPEDEERKKALELLLARHRGNVAAVARELGKARMQVHRWMRRFGLAAEVYRSPAS